MSDPAIAFDITPLQNAHRFRGIGTYVRGLAYRLAAQTEIPIEFWGWTEPDPFTAPPPHRVLALPRMRMPEYRAAWVFSQLAMRRRARRSAAHVLHITDPNALRAIPGRKMLTTVYDLIPLKQGIRWRSVLNRLGYSTYLRALRRADILFAISEQTAGDVAEMLHVPRDRIALAIPGINLPRAGENARSVDRPYFLFIGGPNPNKNLGVVLDAMGQCSDLKDELLIAGLWLPKQVAALEADLQSRSLAGRVRHIGFVPNDELVPLLRDATALLVPSLQEGFGLPVGEGLAAGALVIHSRIPILDEVSAGAALTFDPHSPHELASCMRRAAEGGAAMDDVRAQGLRRATSLTWDAAVKTTLDAYRMVLSR